MWTREKLIASGMAWAEDFGSTTVGVIGVLEIMAAVGLVLPGVLDVAPVLVPWAAVGLALLMVSALVTHVRRHETQPLAVNFLFLTLAVFVAWGRFAA